MEKLAWQEPLHDIDIALEFVKMVDLLGFEFRQLVVALRSWNGESVPFVSRKNDNIPEVTLIDSSTIEIGPTFLPQTNDSQIPVTHLQDKPQLTVHTTTYKTHHLPRLQFTC